MSNGSPPPEKRHGEAGAKPPKRPRNVTGALLVTMIVITCIIVLSQSLTDGGKLSPSRFMEHLVLGHIDRMTQLKGEIEGEFKEPYPLGSRRFTVAFTEDYLNRQFETLASLMSRARRAVALTGERFDRTLDEALAAPAGGVLEVTLVRRDDGRDCLFVEMLSGIDGAFICYRVEPDMGSRGGASRARQPLRMSELYGKIAQVAAAHNPRTFGRAGYRLAEIDVSESGYQVDPESGFFASLILSLLPYVLIVAFIYFFIFRQMRMPGAGGSVLSFGKSRARLASREKTHITFADVAGVDEAKDEVMEIVEFLKHPVKFSKLGGRIPRGILLVGPPGTGKTLLAKAIAGEADVPFFSICGSDFVEMFVGVGASRVRDLFRQAKESSPCIIFLDEIDAVGRRRGAGLGGGHDEREQTLNAILVEMDGFDTDSGIIVMAATNRPDVLDPALLRPGRFDREIVIDLPDVKGREAILRVHARKVKIHPSADLSIVARGTPGFSGADLAAVINEAALSAVMRGKEHVFLDDLEEARDKVLWGRQKQSRVMTEEDRRVTAYHEAGHALVSHMLEEAEPLYKVTIIPRGMALGLTMHLPERDRYVLGRRRATADIQVCFGGRCAEELALGEVTSGASNDIERATQIARKMVTQWGMSERIGLVSLSESEEHVFLGRDIARVRQHSDATAVEVDREVKRILDDCYRAARTVLETHGEALRRIAEALLRYETLTAEEIDALIRGDTVEAVRRGRPDARPKSRESARPAAEGVPGDVRGTGDVDPRGLAGEGA